MCILIRNYISIINRITFHSVVMQTRTSEVQAAALIFNANQNKSCTAISSHPDLCMAIHKYQFH